MKKLLVVAPYFYPKIGGMENYAYNISKGLKEKFGWQIIVIASNHEEKKYKVEKLNGMKIYRLPYWFKLSNTPINPLWYFDIKRIIKDEKPDVINAHTPVPFIADIAGLVSNKIPLLVTYHAFKLYKQNFTYVNLIIKIYKYFEYSLFNKADKIIVVSDAIKEAIPDTFRQKVNVIYNSISKKCLPKKNNLKNYKKLNLIFIGNLDKSHYWKGLSEILKAISLYRDAKISLSIIGNGNFKKHYKELASRYKISKNVKFLGEKSGKVKNSILRNSTIGIIYPTSNNDAFPTVALEYWSQSLPIIAANIAPINTIFKNKKTAYLVKPKDPLSIVNAIKDLLNNKLLFEKLSKLGYLEVKKKYILESEVKKYNSLMKGFAL